MNTSPANEPNESVSVVVSPKWDPDSPTTSLALHLLERYHDVAQSLKELRFQSEAIFEQTHPDALELIERHRANATGLFNHLFVLVQNRLLSPALFSVVLPRRGARLWREYVAPLDYEVRKRAAARADMQAVPLGETDVEVFYRRYEEHGQVMLRVPTSGNPTQ